MHAQSVRIVGASVDVRSASSTTAAIRASTSVGFPASTSCKVDGLWLPTLAAPAIRWSLPTSMVIPNLPAISFASSIALRAIATEGGYVAITPTVACVSAPIGLKHILPRSFTHKFERMLSSTGALKPAAVRAALNSCTLGVTLSSSSPSGSKVPSVCTTSPGALRCAAGYGTHPTIRSAGMDLKSFPSGSTVDNVRPENSPPCL
mmetsp:Transcript_33974/g.62178  ORF Transcript_33974/g.62178 Transcript_33974/m.62178 type:complete len:205 (+) Transcript_33974:179-793(+)